MPLDSNKFAETHDDVFEEIAAALDIPDSKLEEARGRYDSIGAWLGRSESTLAKCRPAISPQGSFLLGTVTRPLNDNDEYDVDLVCLLSEASKSDFTQKQLKDAVGREVALYARAHNMANPPEEGRRCWILTYADGTQFHMDVLPAVPDVQRYRQFLEKSGFRALADNAGLSGKAIAITDNTLPQYALATDDWPLSNPMGYAAWFKSRMTIQLRERKMAFAKRLKITGAVDDIPDYRVKTPLQRAIQLLKRHRDGMFADDSDHKPISIIITTLSAHAYNEEPTIAAALESILTTMDRFIEDRGGTAWVANPVNPSENFADKWAEDPTKRQNFHRWLDQARKDFALYIRANRFNTVPQGLREALGVDLVDRVLKAVFPAAGVAAPAIAQASTRAEAAISQINRTGSQSKPWAAS